MDPREQPTEPTPRVPVVKCPSCAWAMGALSVLDTPMLAQAHLHRALQTHLLAAHGLEAKPVVPAEQPVAPSAEPVKPVLQAG